jgi:hypothetical protein
MFQLADKMRNLADATSLILLKLDFIRIVCSHEHYFPLNLPFGTPLTPSGNSSSPTPSISSITFLHHIHIKQKYSLNLRYIVPLNQHW